MAAIHRRRPWLDRSIRETPERCYYEWTALSRREMVRVAMAAAAFPLLGGTAAIAQDRKSGSSGAGFPAKRNEAFKLDRPITDEQVAARYNNFYEFSTQKRVSGLVRDWDIGGWQFEVTGLVEKPAKFTMDELPRLFPYEERLYRLRCVETWAMAVPWTGFPLHKLLEHVRPLRSAKFVKFISFDHTKVKGTRRNTRSEPFPYTEALTLAEAANELSLMVTGIYGKPLPKQHGAPVRLIVPWKYGFKSAKSIVRIELVDSRPATFWPSIIPAEYDFFANVDPAVPHPRWSQATEWDIGTKARRATLPYNGYGEWVASLYG